MLWGMKLSLVCSAWHVTRASSGKHRQTRVGCPVQSGGRVSTSKWLWQ